MTYYHFKSLFIYLLLTMTSCENIYDKHFIKTNSKIYSFNNQPIECKECKSIEMTISNNPFQLDNTYHMEIYIPYNHLAYSGIYQEKCLLKIPHHYFGQAIIPNIEITNGKYRFRGDRKEMVFSLKNWDEQQKGDYLIFTFIPNEDPSRNYSIQYNK